MTACSADLSLFREKTGVDSACINDTIWNPGKKFRSCVEKWGPPHTAPFKKVGSQFPRLESTCLPLAQAGSGSLPTFLCLNLQIFLDTTGESG